MKRPWIKICGFTTPADAKDAVRAGADLIGLNFCAESPRAVSFGLAARIRTTVEATRRPRGPSRKVRTVAVMVDPTEELVEGILEHVAPDVLQFHGDEPPEFCQSFKKPFFKAFRLKSAADAESIDAWLGGYAIGYLIDAWSPLAAGGTGRRISKDIAHSALQRPKGFLAGGLTPENVGELVRELAPFGVDVASGVETRPGIKSAQRMSAFVAAVEAAVTPG